MAISPAPEGILSVSVITRLIKETLSDNFPAVWVKGELTGFKRHENGHLYFTLREGRDAVLGCVMWRTSAMKLDFQPVDGTEIEAFGSISVYAAQGKYQLSVSEMRPAGIGALLLALEELKRKLQAEGLFDAARKRPLPRFPQRIGLVTSPVGAAVRDMVKVLRARWPSIGIVLAPVRVQGKEAAGEIAAAIQRFNRYAKVDVLIVGRGGGSLEDLWAFNQEEVARAIAGSAIPVISAVGHEVDWTIADAVADLRAATPSNAAELAVRDRAEVSAHLERLASRATRGVRESLDERRRRVEKALAKYGFRRQLDVVSHWQQRIDELLTRVRSAVSARLALSRERLEAVRQRYGLRELPRTLALRREEVEHARQALTASLVTAFHERRNRLTSLGDRLRALSPRQVLERGYCLVRAADGSLVRATEALAVGERVTLEFAHGEADARVEAVRSGGNDAP